MRPAIANFYATRAMKMDMVWSTLSTRHRLYSQLFLRGTVPRRAGVDARKGGAGIELAFHVSFVLFNDSATAI